MRTEVGVGQERAEAGKGLVSKSRVLLAYSMAVALSVVIVGGNVDGSRASPVQLASYDRAGDFVVLSLKNSSMIPARSSQETLSSGYDVVSKQIGMAAVISAIGSRTVSDGFTDIISPQVACQRGGRFDACPGFMELLEGRERNLRHLMDVPVSPVLEPVTVVASLGGDVNLSNKIPASIDTSETEVPSNAIELAPIGNMIAGALDAQAACMTGGMFDACPGFMDVLRSRQQAWPELARNSQPETEAPLRIASLSNGIFANVDERVSLSMESGGMLFDQPEMQSGEVIVGIASTYNPFDKNDRFAGGAETASGELYNPIAWTAAIQLKLRGKFAGVRYGRLYKPRFALVELNGKRAIVKINDVGPLRPGRVIDFSTQVMHYFDPTLERGVLDGVLVTPLVGADWTPGPLGSRPAIAVASSAP